MIRDGINPDNQIIIPYTTAMKQLLGVTSLDEVDIQVNQGEDLTKTQAAITRVLRKRHRIQGEEDPDDFNVHNQADIISMAY